MSIARRSRARVLPGLVAVPTWLACSVSEPGEPPQGSVAAAAPAGLARGVVIELGEERAVRSRSTSLPLVEPCIAAHPQHDGHLLIGAMVITDVERPYESARLASFLSLDGGTNWSETEHDSWDYDPWVAIQADGETVLAWIGTPGGFQDRYPIQFFRSSDGGRTWRAPETLEGAHDGTKVVAWKDRFWFTTVRFREDMETEVVLFGAQGSGPFEEVARIEGRGDRIRFCEPAVLSDGRVVVPARRDELTWVQIYDPRTRQLGPEQRVRSEPGTSQGYLRLVADSSEDSPFRDRLYFAHAASRGDEHLGILLNVSDDQGRSWSADRRVDLFEHAGDSRAQLATLAVGSGGVLAVSWVDAREDPARRANDVYLTVSRDGGESFTRPVRVSTVSSDPRTERNDDVAAKFPGGGHYMGLAARASGSFQLVWSDSREGLFVLRTREARVGL